jgi:oxygen-independent coproporphyrinogen-3 oxidase
VTGPSVYVHLPFCPSKCPYCDFNSYEIEGEDVDAYIDALQLEFDARGFPPDPRTIYVGGGTPTVLSPGQLARCLDLLGERARPRPGREFTVEANPGTLSPAIVQVLKEAGVNRLSIGAQSFEDRHLETLGRAHDAGDVDEAYRRARAAGIATISLDLIYAVPGMSTRDWIETLERALSLGPDHLSCYALTYEAGTPFSARRSAGALDALDEETELSMFRWTGRLLGAAGFHRYEVSSYAPPGRECQHNITYWHNYSYVGFGAGAHSYLEGRRAANERDPSVYAESIGRKGDAVVFEERLDGKAGAGEMIALALRTAHGADLEVVSARFGLDAAVEFRAVIEPLSAAGLLEDAGRLRVTRRGWRVVDAIAAEFLSLPEAQAVAEDAR